MIKKGIGIACAFQGTNYHFGYPDVSNVSLEITENNEFVIHAAASDVGQGLEATLIKIVSDTFGGLRPSRIRWTGSSTREPDAGVTGASRQTTMTGNAVFNAAMNLMDLLRSTACELLDASTDKIAFSGEIVTSDTNKQAKLDDVINQARSEGRILNVSAIFKAPSTTAVDEYGKGEPINQFGYATCIAEVEVETETGEVAVTHIRCYSDAGRILHRIGAEGQVEGGVIMGLGYALSENFMMQNGDPVNVGLTNYLIPTIKDSPATEIEAHFIDNPVPMGKLGVKGLAELPNTVIAPAILNAIFNATGARVTTLPATPERVYYAIQELEGETSSE